MPLKRELTPSFTICLGELAGLEGLHEDSWRGKSDLEKKAMICLDVEHLSFKQYNVSV